MSFTSKLTLVFALALSCISASGQSGNSSGIKTTNSPFVGAMLLTDGTRYYWGTPTNLQASVTNAQPPSTTLTNLSATGAITNLNANQFSGTTITSIKSGALLTNTVNEGVTIFNGDSSNRANLIVKGAVNPKFRLTSVSPPQVLQLSSTAISTDAGGGQAYITISPEDYPTLRINTNSLESINPGYDLGVLGTPWAYAYVNTNRNKGIHLFGGQAASSLLRLDSGTNVATVTIGSGLSFDGTTLTASAGGALTTNANQFGASVTLTIASGALLTNLQVRGIDPLGLTASRALSLNASGDITNGTTTAAELEFVNGVTSAIQTQLGSKQAGTFLLTNFSAMGITNIVSANANTVITTNSGVLTLTTAGTGSPGGSSADVQFNQSGSFAGTNTLTYDRTNNILTAGSFYGSGTGVPIIKLQTMMSADNAFAITVATNWMQSTTNSFVFTNVVAGQVISAHSSSAGQVVWTNATAAGGGASVTFSAIPTALNSVSNYAKQLMWQSMKPSTSTTLDRQSAESPNTQGGGEIATVNASLPLGLSATNHTGLYGWFPSTDQFHWSTRDHASTFLVSFVGQTSSNRTWIGQSGAAGIYNTDVPGTPTYGFRHSSVVADNNWVCYSADGTRTVSNLVTTGSITTNVLYALATVKTGTNVIFYVDGSPKFTNHFDPAGAIMGYRIIGSKAGATGARSGINLHDYFSTTTIP